MKKKIKKISSRIVGFLIGAICGVLIVIIVPPVEQGGIFLLHFFAALIFSVFGFVLHIFYTSK